MESLIKKEGLENQPFCAHLAMSLYHNNNFKKAPTFVSVFDTDYPQLSIYKWREWEWLKLKELNDEGNYFYENKLSKVYNDSFPPLNIYKGDIPELKLKINNLKEIFDYTFIDVVGTVNTEGYHVDFLKMFDIIIIPTSGNFESVRSTMEFVKNIIKPLSEKRKH